MPFSDDSEELRRSFFNKNKVKMVKKIFERNNLLWGKSFYIYPKKDGKIWFEDRITTGGKSIEESHLSTMTDKNLRKCTVAFQSLCVMVLTKF